MKDFDAMEDLETFKTNFPQQTNPLYEAVKRAFWIATVALVGFTAVVLFYVVCRLIVE